MTVNWIKDPISRNSSKLRFFAKGKIPNNGQIHVNRNYWNFKKWGNNINEEDENSCWFNSEKKVSKMIETKRNRLGIGKF